MLQARTEEHLAQEQAWLASERIWLLHRGGFTPATKCGPADADTGKLRVRLIPTGEELLVDEEDVEKVYLKSIKFYLLLYHQFILIYFYSYYYFIHIIVCFISYRKIIL